MKNKGFTLIELLAVIVILAIIALIATPMILNVVENARKSSAESSVLGYIDAVEKQIMLNEMDSSKKNIIDDTYTILNDGGITGTKNGNTSKIAVEVKGKVPTGTVVILNHKVASASTFTVSGYSVSYDASNGTATATKSGSSSNTESGSSNAPTIDTCPGCVYAYTTDTWYYDGANKTTLSSSQYKENYDDVISESGKNYFLGIKLNASGTIEKAYVCGIKDGNPFCLEGAIDGSTYNKNKTLLQSERLWNNSCDVWDDRTLCGEDDSLYVYMYDDGDTGISIGDYYCAIEGNHTKCGKKEMVS